MSQRCRLRRLALLSAATAAVYFGNSMPARAQTTTIAVTGSAAPGLPAGAKFFSFSSPQLNNAGQVGFLSTLLTGSGGVTSSNDTVLWSGLPLALQLAAREGSAAPGTGAGPVFNSFTDVRFNSLGQLAFTGFLLIGTGGVTNGNDHGIWGPGAGGAVQLVAREGSAAPGVPGAIFNPNLDAPLLNDTGETGFIGVLTSGVGGVTTANDVGIWVGPPTNLQILAREGDAAPDTPVGANFQSIISPISLSAGSFAAFNALLVIGTGGVTTDNNEGIWAGVPGGVQLVQREGDQAPGTASGVFFDNFDTPLVNANGQIALIGNLKVAGSVTTDNDKGIWAGTPGSLVLAAREGSQAPGTPAGAHFRDFGDPVINAVGQIAFVATLVQGSGGVISTNSSGLWAGSPASVQLVARTGSQAGGLPDGVVFQFIGAPAFNANGQLAFSGDLVIGSGGVTANNQTVLYMADTTGEQVLVAREGDGLAGKIISDLAIVNSGGQDGRGSSLNDFGQLVYEADFTDGTHGLFLFTPEVHYRRTSSGSWATKTNWTLSIAPAQVHSVFIDPAASLTVTGPATDTVIKSLEIGGGSGLATLALQAGAVLSVIPGPVTIKGTGNLTGDGTLLAAVVNDGTITSPTNLTITGGLTNHGVISGSGRINAVITNSSGAQVRVSTGQRLLVAGGPALSTNQGRFDVLGGELEWDGPLKNLAQIDVIDGTFRAGSSVDNITDASLTARNSTLFIEAGLFNAGTFGFSFGTSDVFGSMFNSSGGKIILSGNSQTTFYGPITNNPGAELRVSAGSTAVFFGAVNSTGLISGGGTKIFEGGGSGLGPLATPGSTIVEAPASVTASFIRENSLTVNGHVTIDSSGGTSHLNQLNIDPQGVLDLKNNSLVLENGDLQAITAQIRSGLNSGTGIVSTAPGAPFRLGSMSNAGTIYSSFQGISGLNGDEVLIRYTRIGDLNLDGTVTISDFIDLASNFNHIGGSTWQMGDVNYDGSVTISDFIDLASNFNQSVAGEALPISASDWAILAEFAASNVPEPTTCSLILAGSLLMCRRTRKTVVGQIFVAGD